MKSVLDPLNQTQSSESRRTAIREKAQEMVRERASQSPENQVMMSAEGLQRTLFELQVHQIELEMQNEELHRVQSELAAERARYFDLYDQAPMGYMTLSQNGQIIETNHTAAALLEIDQSVMAGQLIYRFIFSEDQDIYYMHRKQLLETGEPQKFELRLVKDDGAVFWAQMWAVIVYGSDGIPAFRAVLSDITERKDAADAVTKAKEEVSAAMLAKKQMSILQSQIKPHFLYNALNAIISLCYSDGPMAGDLLTRFSQYLRIIFDYNSQDEIVTLHKELELVHVYVDIEKVRYGERLITEFDVDESLLENKVMCLILQPLVENAIRHGVSKKTEGGTVKLRVKRDKAFIKVTISDDGVGMSKALIREIMERDETEYGVGIANINQRLYLSTGKKLMIKSKEGVGTNITLYLPLENEE